MPYKLDKRQITFGTEETFREQDRLYWSEISDVENNVIYLLLGRWAVGFYGNPRATKDIDYLISGGYRIPE